MKRTKEVLGKKTYNKVWDKSHDVIERVVSLDKLYDNVPEKLKKKKVIVMEIHTFEDEDLEDIMNWKSS